MSDGVARTKQAPGTEANDDLVSLLARLVREPSLGPGAATETCLQLLEEHLTRTGVEASSVRSEAGVPTLRATLRGEQPGRHVCFSATSTSFR